MADTINETLENLRAAIELAAACCEAGQSVTGQEIDDPPSDGIVEVGEGQQFETQEDYLDAKCNAANGIFDTTREMLDWLDVNSVDINAGLFGGWTTAIVLGLLVSGPVGWAVTLSGVLVSSLAAFAVAKALDFESAVDAMDDVHDELVLSLFNASDSETALTSFMATLATASGPPGTVMQQFIKFLIGDKVLNQLFNPRSDVATYTSPSPVDCGGAILQTWDFDSDFESWTFVDDSEVNGLAVRSYNATAESIATQLTSTSARSTGTHTSPALAIAVVAGASVQFDYSQSSDGLNWGKSIIATYSDMSEFQITRTNDKGPSTLILTLPSAGTLASIDIITTRGNGARTPYDIDVQILEVRVIGL